MIADHCDVSYELENKISGTDKEQSWHLSATYRPKAPFRLPVNGLGHAILTGETLVNHDAFGVILADDLCIADDGEPNVMAQMVALYKQFRCSIVAVMEVPQEETSKYGVIAGNKMSDSLYQVSEMVEKPEPLPSKAILVFQKPCIGHLQTVF